MHKKKIQSSIYQKLVPIINSNFLVLNFNKEINRKETKTIKNNIKKENKKRVENKHNSQKKQRHKKF